MLGRSLVCPHAHAVGGLFGALVTPDARLRGATPNLKANPRFMPYEEFMALPGSKGPPPTPPRKR